MHTGDSIQAQWRRDDRLIPWLAIAPLVLMAAMAPLLVGPLGWRSRLDELVATDAAIGQLALHFAIPALPALALVALVVIAGERRAARRRCIRCVHCHRPVRHITLRTGACVHCGRPTVTPVGAGRAAPSTNDRSTSGGEMGPAPMTSAELRGMLRRAALPALAGMLGTIVGMAMLALILSWVGDGRPAFETWRPASRGVLLGAVVLTAIGPLLIGCAVADRKTPRCPACRAAIRPIRLVLATGRCQQCGVEIVRRQCEPRRTAPLRDRAHFNRGADLFRRMAILPCIAGGIVGIGLLALVRDQLDAGRGWLGIIAIGGMMATIFLGAFLLPRLIDRRVARGHGTCPTCGANLLESRDIVGGTGHCCRCGGAVFPSPDS